MGMNCMRMLLSILNVLLACDDATCLVNVTYIPFTGPAVRFYISFCMSIHRALIDGAQYEMLKVHQLDHG